MSAIRVEGLTKRYGTVAAAYELAFDIPSGGALALLGPAGCGKTTILRCLAGLETPEWGTIEIAGEAVFDRARGIDLPPERRSMGVVFQSYAVWPHMTVLDNVAFPLKVRGVKPARRRERASEMLGLVGLQGFEDLSAALLSAAQQQRVALARALVHAPGLVLFDEVLANLDSGLRQQMRGEFRSLRERVGFTAVYVTRDHADAFALADDILLLNQGGMEMRGPPREVFSRPRSAFAARFFGMNVLEGRLLGAAADSRYLEVELSARLVVRGVAAPDQQLVEGGRVFACIRKDAVRVVRPSTGQTAAGVIATASFLGAEEEYQVDIAGIRIEAVGAAAGLAKGDPVHVTMTPDEWVFVR
jgi:iron(III) transport system ATP-binding protein